MSYRILLVDDEKWVRTALRKTIEKSSLPVQVVHESSNGIDAWDWLRANEADLVFTDIRMPVMDGLALVKAIGEQRLPVGVVIISGHDDFAYAQQAMRHGVFDYLLKPVEEEELARCVRSWIGKKEDEEADARKEPDAEIDIQDLPAVEQVIHHIVTKRAFDLSSSDAAELVHLNPSYFSKIFKQHTGVTYTDYITGLKIGEAARLLEKTALRVTEIGERLGFSDPAYFSNTFKKTIGQTPSEYRKHYQPKKDV